MELFWYFLFATIALIGYVLSHHKPTIYRATLFYGSFIVIAGLLFSTGIDIPGKGFDISSSTQILALSTSYTISNSPLVFAAAFGFFALGIRGFWVCLQKFLSGGVNPDGSFK